MTLRAAIFDMDGLLVDSEPLWRRAEVEVFRTVGLELTEAMCEDTTGLRIDEVVAHWHAQSPWSGAGVEDVAGRIVERVIGLVSSEGRALPGAREAVERCGAAGLRLALASSSPARLIAATLEHLGLTERFEVLASAELERFGKPHPAVFLAASDALGIEPSSCVVFEDSVNGVLAAKAARMRCVVVPDPSQASDRRFGIADRVLPSLEAFDVALLAEL